MNAEALPDALTEQQHFEHLLSTPDSMLALKAGCVNSQLLFTRAMHRAREETRFTMLWHHRAMARAYDMVFRGEINRLIINVSPGFTKTMMLLDAHARLFGIDPRSRSIHTTYNKTLAVENSTLLQDTMKMPLYQRLYPTRIRQDTSGKGKWKTEQGGTLLAAGVRGTLTGFRAGLISPKPCTGILSVDDPIKPEDTYSRTIREKTNRAFPGTIRSRLMMPSTPVVLTMQRLHDQDPSGFLLRGGTGDQWHHLCLPARITKRDIKPGKNYARKYPYGKPLVFDDLFQKGFIWPDKVDARELAIIMDGDPLTGNAQYLQNPQIVEGNFIKMKWLRFYKELPHWTEFRRVDMIVDTAIEADDHHDRTVWAVFGQTRDGRAWLLDYWGARLEVPDIEKTLQRQWQRWRNPPARTLPRIGRMYVERRASGHGIIQGLRRKGVAVKAIERSVDKVRRSIEAVPAFTAGGIMLPAKNYRGPFTDNDQYPDMIEELMQFSTDMSHANDDYCDVLFDAAEIYYHGKTTFGEAFG